MRIVEIRDEAELPGLRPAWDRLLADSASNTIFLTWDWIAAWWHAYGTPGELRILIALDDANGLRGLAPLRRETKRKYGCSFPVVSFIGDGSCDSDYLDFIVAVGHERAVMEAFCSYLRPEIVRGTVLELNDIPACSPNLPFLRDLGTRSGMICTEADVPCATVRLPGDWQAYLKTLSPRFRTKVRSVLRNLEQRPDLSFGFCHRSEDLTALLPCLYDLHRRRWAKEAKAGVFQWEKKRHFYETLSPLMLGRGWLSFSWLAWRGQILACQYGFTYDGRYFQLQEGYEPASEHWSVGIALRAWSIQELLKRGVREYDFLGGVGRHKSDWGAAVKFSKRMLIGGPDGKTLLYCRGPQWMSRTRQSAKKLLPTAAVAARDARQERRRAALFEGRRSAIPAKARAVVSSCYFYSPLPSLLTPVRDRYLLRPSPQAPVLKLRVAKRRGPSARILYFHRVNDDGDPFLPAIPTAVFDWQMRFLARHHRVVSLREATRRLLCGGPPEPVVALTFDDGYQDNYLNAFPILQRYGLPATIFLTTGCIDERELLWFEKLALAVKKTAIPFLDLEIDVPRRVWMRTEPERLQANAEIHGILRRLPDAARRERLMEILRGLGACEERGGGRMLTWEQIRFMKRMNIDFGGHTVSHPFVSRLQPEHAAWEISECKRRIEEELQASAEHFAYPHGREEDFQAWNKEIIQAAGYRAAVSTLWGVNYPTTDLMGLRRGGPGDESRALFAAKLDWYQWADA